MLTSDTPPTPLGVGLFASHSGPKQFVPVGATEVVSTVAWRFKILCSQKWLAKVGLDTVALMMDVMVIGIVGKEELARIPP